MEIEFTLHARQMLTERKIAEKSVRSVIKKPDNTAKRQGGTVIAQKKIKWHNREVLCRVIYTQPNPKKARVITAYITTQLKKYAAKL